MTLPSLPFRAGPRPRTGPAVPHTQLDQLSPPVVRNQLRQWMSDALPGTHTGPSEISDPGTMRRWMASAFPDKPIPHDIPDEQALAVFLDTAVTGEGVVLMPPSLTREFAHIHPDGWGERHPLYSPQQVNVVMLFGPRDGDELDVARTIVRAAHQYATSPRPVVGS
ncbi:hypothetical protein AB0346_18600 [Nocardia beijingensis]|uniref:luciferase domain-containing protein n=1 Tax=Nocardia beijingensis TaxID=95162 RepID=UPI00344BDE2A